MFRKFIVSMVLVACCALAVSAFAQASATGLVGSWKLVSHVDHRSETDIRYPSGQDAIGFATFDAAGNVALQIKGRGYLSYFGKYTFDAATSQLKITISGSDYFDTGKTIQRKVEVGENRVVFIPSEWATIRSTWERAK